MKKNLNRKKISLGKEEGEKQESEVSMTGRRRSVGE